MKHAGPVEHGRFRGHGCRRGAARPPLGGRASTVRAARAPVARGGPRGRWAACGAAWGPRSAPVGSGQTSGCVQAQRGRAGPPHGARRRRAPRAADDAPLPAWGQAARRRAAPAAAPRGPRRRLGSEPLNTAPRGRQGPLAAAPTRRVAAGGARRLARRGPAVAPLRPAGRLCGAPRAHEYDSPQCPAPFNRLPSPFTALCRGERTSQALIILQGATHGAVGPLPRARTAFRPVSDPSKRLPPRQPAPLGRPRVPLNPGARHVLPRAQAAAPGSPNPPMASKDTSADVRADAAERGGAPAPAPLPPRALDELEFNVEADRRRTATWWAPRSAAVLPRGPGGACLLGPEAPRRARLRGARVTRPAGAVPPTRVPFRAAASTPRPARPHPPALTRPPCSLPTAGRTPRTTRSPRWSAPACSACRPLLSTSAGPAA
jgi:hypothetical protein